MGWCFCFANILSDQKYFAKHLRKIIFLTCSQSYLKVPGWLKKSSSSKFLLQHFCIIPDGARFFFFWKGGGVLAASRKI